MTRERIVADNWTFKDILEREINHLGFSADLNHIDVSNVTDMSKAFMHSKFNGDISKWDVSKVENMKEMFELSSFNGDISNWNVSNVKVMVFTFADSDFSGDISKWNINPQCNINYALAHCPASESPTPGVLHFMCKDKFDSRKDNSIIAPIPVPLHPDVQAFYDFNAPLLDGKEPHEKAQLLVTLYQEREQAQPVIDFTMGLEPSEQAMGSSGFSFDAPDEQSTGLTI